MPIFIPISNPFAVDNAGRRHTAKFADFYAKDECLYFGIGGFPARYWAKLEINEFIKGGATAKWNNLYELPIKSYPETKLRQRLENQKSGN